MSIERKKVIEGNILAIAMISENLKVIGSKGER